MPAPLTITTCSFCSASGFEAQCARGQVRQIHCAAVLGRSLAEPWNVMMESTCETYAVPCCALSANSDVFGCSSLTVLTVLFFLRIFWGAPCLTKKMVDYGYDWHWLTNYDWLIMSGCFFQHSCVTADWAEDWGLQISHAHPFGHHPPVPPWGLEQELGGLRNVKQKLGERWLCLRIWYLSIRLLLPCSHLKRYDFGTTNHFQAQPYPLSLTNHGETRKHGHLLQVWMGDISKDDEVSKNWLDSKYDAVATETL